MELEKEDIRKELYEFGCGYMLDEYMELFNEIGKIYHNKQLLIQRVVFNEALANDNSVLDEPQLLYKDYDTEVKSEVELFCSNCKSTHVYQPEPESIKCYRCGFYGAK